LVHWCINKLTHYSHLFIDLTLRTVWRLFIFATAARNTVCMGLELIRTELQDLKTTPPNSNNNNTTSKRTSDGGQDSAAATCSSSTTESSTADTTIVSSLRELAGEVADNAHSAVLLLNDLLNYDKVRITLCAALYEQYPEFNDNSSMTRSLLQYPVLLCIGFVWTVWNRPIPLYDQPQYRWFSPPVPFSSSTHLTYSPD